MASYRGPASIEDLGGRTYEAVVVDLWAEGEAWGGMVYARGATFAPWVLQTNEFVIAIHDAGRCVCQRTRGSKSGRTLLQVQGSGRVPFRRLTPLTMMA